MLIRSQNELVIDELEFAPAVAPLQISEHRGEVARSRPNDVPRGLEQLHRPPAEAERLEDRRILLAQSASTSIRGLLAIEKFPVADNRRSR